jgi:uncharacterized protein YegL
MDSVSSLTDSAIQTADGNVCAICLSGIRRFPTKTLSCGHVFHEDCLRKMNQFAISNCPLCRRIITSPLIGSSTPFILSQPSPFATTRGRSVETGQFIPPLIIPDDEDVAPFSEFSQEEIEQMMPALIIKTEFPSFYAGKNGKMLSMAEINVPAVVTRRIPMDLVIIVDNSGSMDGSPINIVKDTLKYVIRELSENDRISIITFNSTPQIICGLKRINPENRVNLIRDVEQIRASNSTNISAGLRAGFRVIEARHQQSSISGILFMSDGYDTCDGILAIEHVLSEHSETLLSTGIYCFGYGDRHDAHTLNSISQRGRGSFTFIETVETIGPSFGVIIGSLISIVAQNIHLEIKVFPESRIDEIHLPADGRIRGNLIQIESASSGSMSYSSLVNFVLPNLISGEKKNLLFTINFPISSEATRLETALDFCPPDSARMMHTSLVIFTLPRTSEEIPLIPSIEINIQWNRISAANVMLAAIEHGKGSDVETAKALLTSEIERINNSISNSDPICVKLISDLIECQERFRDQRTFTQGGAAFAYGQYAGHSQQRTTTYTGPTDGSAYGYTPSQKHWAGSYALPPDFRK